MLTTLIESRHARTRTAPAQLFSVGLHGALILAAVMATRQVATIVDETPTPDIRYVRPATPPTPQAVDPSVAAPRLKGFLVLPAVIKIPDVLPDIDLSKALTNPDNYLLARGKPGGDPNGVEPAGNGDAFTVEQVDRPAHLMPGSGRPVYPEALRSAGVGGEVLAQFVIDTAGRADMRTLEIIATTHERLTESVRRALEKARFVPAEFGERRVRQVVRMPFVFSLQK